MKLAIGAATPPLIAPRLRMRLTGAAVFAVVGVMLVVNVRGALRFRQQIDAYQRFLRMATEQCSYGNVDPTRNLLHRVRSLAPDAADEDYVREATARFRAGDCTIIILSPPPGFVDVIVP